jgi:hypothetical protein
MIHFPDHIHRNPSEHKDCAVAVVSRIVLDLNLIEGELFLQYLPHPWGGSLINLCFHILR